MSRAIWESVILPESKDCVVVEDNQYFPNPSSANTSSPAATAQCALGRAWPATTTLKSMARSTLTQRGTMRNLRTRRDRFATDFGPGGVLKGSASGKLIPAFFARRRSAAVCLDWR
jgi:hypothetical protein